MLLKIVCFLPHSVSWSYFKTGSECAAAIVHASRTLCMLGLAQGPKDYSWKLQKRLGAVLKKPGREQSPESCHTQRLSKLLRYRKLIFVDLITTSLHYKNGRERRTRARSKSVNPPLLKKEGAISGPLLAVLTGTLGHLENSQQANYWVWA